MISPGGIAITDVSAQSACQVQKQVRELVGQSGMDRWRNYAPRVRGLKETLGQSLTNWCR
jgi:hypothetical protein